MKPAQIGQIAARAAQLGLTRDEVDGLLGGLLMHAAQPDGATKLDLAIRLMAPQQRTDAQAFVRGMDEAGADRLARGRALLEALPDSEWAGLFDGQDEDEVE